MPKIKTHKGTAKRVRISPTGKVLRSRANASHHLEKKSAGRKRNLVIKAGVKGAIARSLKKALGV